MVSISEIIVMARIEAVTWRTNPETIGKTSDEDGEEDY